MWQPLWLTLCMLGKLYDIFLSSAEIFQMIFLIFFCAGILSECQTVWI